MQSYGRWVIRLVVIMIDWGLFQSFKLFLHTFSYNCIRVAAAAEGAVYEVVESHRGSPRSRRTVGSRPKAQLTPVLSSRRKASPGARPTILNYITYICL